MILKTKLLGHVYEFKSVKDALAKANEEKSGDRLAGIAAENAEERVAAKVVVANLTLADLRANPAVPYEEDEVTRIIQDDVNEKIYEEIRNWTVAELREIIEYVKAPFIIKGIMTVAGARKALEAGAAGIVVSNHGGRVQDGVPATARVLPAIAQAVKGQMTILVDGGIRTGVDVCKALALGADACILARPYVTAVYGGGAEGVAVLTQKLKGELEDTMAMCGVHSLTDISSQMIFQD